MALDHPVDHEFVLYEDGTSFWQGTGNYGNVVQQSSAALRGINQWAASGTVPSGSYYFGFMFPEPRNITAFSLYWADDNYADRGLVHMQVSTNATNFTNGTWDQKYNHDELLYWREPYGGSANIPKLRVPWVVAWPNIVGIRMLTNTNGYQGLSEIHFWGNYAHSGLAFWDATSDTIMNAKNFDFGEIGQGTTHTRTFRIKNNRNLTANNVNIAAPSGGVGSVVAGLEFSDGGAFAPSITIPSIATGATSPVITVRRTVGAVEAITNGCGRVTAVAQSWT